MVGGPRPAGASRMKPAFAVTKVNYAPNPCVIC